MGIINSKKAWIRIFEAVIAVLLITSVLLIVIGQDKISKNEDVLKIYKTEISMLREIQLDNLLREDILDIEFFPVEWDDFDSNGLSNVKARIISKIPDYLDCKAMVCEMNATCILEEDLGKEVYAQSAVITASLDKYSPRQLKLFCWIGTPPPEIELPEEPDLCGNGICEGDETWETCPEDCEAPAQTCAELGGIICTFQNFILTCERKIVSETGCVWDFNDECDEWSGGGVRTGSCGSWPWDPDEAYECYNIERVVTECLENPVCPSGYSEVERSSCTSEQTCLGVIIDASDTDRCCLGTCGEPPLPQADLTLLFSNTVYSLENGNEHTYTHTRTFTESNGVGVTLTQSQICFLDGTCDTWDSVNHRIEAGTSLIRFNELFWTPYNPDAFALTYLGTDDNDYAITITQSLCVQGASFTENCVI